MPITEVFEKDCVEYKITLDQAEETVTAKQLLLLDPLQVELYSQLCQWKAPFLNFKHDAFSKKIKLMIVDYFEVQHMDVGMQLLANELGNERIPPLFLLTDIVFYILKSPRIKTKENIRKHWMACKKGHGILVDVLYYFGSSVYVHFWEDLYSGRSHKLTMHQRLQRGGGDIYNDEEQGKMDEIVKLFEKYSDFWNLIEGVLKPGNALGEQCELLIADFLVKFLQTDLIERKDESNKVRKSLFLKTLQNDAMNTYRNFDRYLGTITQQLPFEDPHRLQIAENLLNMLITVSCYDAVMDQNELVEQMAIIYKKLDNDQSRQLLEMIKYPTFTLNLLDEVLSTADVTNVANDHYFYAEVRHVPLQLEKLFEYVLKTKPPSIRSINDIYRHVVDVSQYTLNVLSTISVRGYRKTGESPLALTDDQVTYLRTNGPTAIEKWESLVEKQIKPYTTPSTKSTKQKIRWTVKLTKLAVLNL